jgi:hypothetical protein
MILGYGEYKKIQTRAREVCQGRDTHAQTNHSRSGSEGGAQGAEKGNKTVSTNVYTHAPAYSAFYGTA